MKKKKVRLHVEILSEYNRGYSARVQNKRRIPNATPHWSRGWHAADAEIKTCARRKAVV